MRNISETYVSLGNGLGVALMPFKLRAAVRVECPLGGPRSDGMNMRP